MDLRTAIDVWGYWVAHGRPLKETIASSLGWLKGCWGQGEDHLPFGVVHDLGHLLCEGRSFLFASTRLLAQWPEQERALRLHYEDRVIGRWALDPTVQEASVIIAGLPKAARDAAVVHAVNLALARALRNCGLDVWNFAELRALAETIPNEVPDDFVQYAARLDPDDVQWGREQLEKIIKVLPTGRLFGAEDLWELEHLQALPNESARLALREINTVGSSVGPVSAGVMVQILRKSKEVPVDADEPDQYPAGGFDALSTKGSFENLVRSEVAYVGEGAEESGGVDLFDVRFAENELLFYTRDESPLLDARHDVTFVIDRPHELRHKHPALSAQTLVLAEGTCLALLADLTRAFGTAGVRAKIVWRVETPQDREAANEEKGLIALALASEIAHHRLELLVVAKWDEVPAMGRIVFAARPEAAELNALFWLRVGDEIWRHEGGNFDLRPGGPALRALCDALLLSVARGRPAKRTKKRGRITSRQAPPTP